MDTLQCLLFQLKAILNKQNLKNTQNLKKYTKQRHKPKRDGFEVVLSITLYLVQKFLFSSVYNSLNNAFLTGKEKKNKIFHAKPHD